MHATTPGKLTSASSPGKLTSTSSPDLIQVVQKVLREKVPANVCSLDIDIRICLFSK